METKQFAMTYFHHEESLPYSMDLFNGIKILTQVMKILFQSRHHYASQRVIPQQCESDLGDRSPMHLLTNQKEYG